MSDDEPTDYQSSYSFGVDLSTMLGKLPDIVAAKLYTLATDQTAGLRTVAPRAIRDESIRALARALRKNATGGLVARELDRYATTAYPKEREAGPPADATELRRLLWRAVHFSGGIALSAKTVSRILADDLDKTPL